MSSLCCGSDVHIDTFTEVPVLLYNSNKEPRRLEGQPSHTAARWEVEI